MQWASVYFFMSWNAAKSCDVYYVLEVFEKEREKIYAWLISYIQAQQLQLV